MVVDESRRGWLQGALAGACLGASPALRAFTAPAAIRDVRAHGARGDGRRDDTAAFQAAIDALPAIGGTVLVPAGNYLIDPLRSIHLRSGVHLRMAADARLVAKPNTAPRAYVLSIIGVHDVEISGGRILGDRARHLSRAGEWGHGVMIRGSRRISLHDLHVADCWGDGISIGASGGRVGTPAMLSQDVSIAHVVCTGNRRQGLTIGRCRNVRVRQSRFLDTGGTLPGCGIDVEPDPGAGAEGILIEECLARGNQGAGIQLYDRSRDVTVRRCQLLQNRGDGIRVQGAGDCLIEDNEIRDNGLRGIAVKGLSHDLRITGNRFDGNARLTARRQGGERGWMHVDVAASARAIRIERDNRYGL